MQHKYKIKNHLVKISVNVYSQDRCFYVQPLLFLTNTQGQIRDLEDVIGADYRISSCQGVIFDRQQQCFFIDLSVLERDIRQLSLVLAAPANYQFYALQDYRVSIETQTPYNHIALNTVNCVIDQGCDFVQLFDLVRHTRHSGWYIHRNPQAIYGDLSDLYRVFDYADYFYQPVLNTNMI